MLNENSNPLDESTPGIPDDQSAPTGPTHDCETPDDVLGDNDQMSPVDDAVDESSSDAPPAEDTRTLSEVLGDRASRKLDDAEALKRLG